MGLGPVRGELGDIGGGEQAPAGGTGTAVGGQVRVATLAVQAVRAGDPPGHLPHASCYCSLKSGSNDHGEMSIVVTKN